MNELLYNATNSRYKCARKRPLMHRSYTKKTFYPAQHTRVNFVLHFECKVAACAFIINELHINYRKRVYCQYFIKKKKGIFVRSSSKKDYLQTFSCVPNTVKYSHKKTTKTFYVAVLQSTWRMYSRPKIELEKISLLVGARQLTRTSTSPVCHFTNFLNLKFEFKCTLRTERIEHAHLEPFTADPYMKIGQ